MIATEYARGLTEVLTILDNTPQEYTNKIPEKVKKFFQENAAKDYAPTFDPTGDLKDMNLKKETKHILSVIYLNYWAETKEEKQQFQTILKQNQQTIDQTIREKYNPDKIFEKEPETLISEPPVKPSESLTQYKESFIKKLMTKIKTWLSEIFKGSKR